MKLKPRLVLSSNNLSFESDRSAGISSILTGLGFPNAERVVRSLQRTFEESNLVTLMETVRLSTNHGIAASTICFLILLQVYTYNTAMSKLTETTPRFTSGYGTLVRMFSKLDDSTYNEVLEWLGYPTVDYRIFIQEPYKYLDWVAEAEPMFQKQMMHLKERNAAYFLREVYLRLGEEDLLDYSSTWRDIKTWAAIAFDDYPLGADPYFMQRYI